MSARLSLPSVACLLAAMIVVTAAPAQASTGQASGAQLTQASAAQTAAASPAGACSAAWPQPPVTGCAPPARASAGPAGPAADTGPGWNATRSVDPAARQALHVPAQPAVADANGGSLALNVKQSLETAQGVAETAQLPGPGGGSVQLYSLGDVSVTAPDGRAVWQRSTASLYADWHLSFQFPGYTPTPQVAMGSDVADPFELATAGQDEVANLHPVATGYLAGRPAVAVAETVGINLGGASCFHCEWPFTVPGSSLHVGTFVTVLDGSTGATMYSELDPGVVTQLAITGGRLIVGDETGDPTASDPLGAWGSVTSVRALSFRLAAGNLVAATAWVYRTGAPWARLLDLRPAAGNIAVTWSDTPLGLGVPGPPDGNVVLIGKGGHVRWQVRTAGYPVLASYDPGRALLAVAEETDPTVSIGYTVAGLRLVNGAVAVSIRVPGVLPTTLSAGQAGTGTATPAGGDWFAAGIVTTPGLVNPPYFGYTGGSVTALNPDSGLALWSKALAGNSGGAPFPARAVSAASSHGPVVVAASWTGLVLPTPSQPVNATSDLQALSAAGGSPVWNDPGNVADPLSVRGGASVIYGVTDNGDAVTYGTGTGSVRGVVPLMNDPHAAVRADVTGYGASDLVIGTLSGGVYALDGRNLSHVLWQANVGGPVNQITLARPTPGGPPVLVVAATSSVRVLAVQTGRVLVTKTFQGQYVWNATAGTLGSVHGAVVVGTNQLTAFDAVSGRTLWTWRPPAASYFSDAAIVDGTVVAEFQSRGSPLFGTPTAMGAVGIDGTTGTLAWSAPADPATTRHALLWNGVIASPDIPGAGTDGVALSWMDANFAGRVDVRDAVTGALLYSNAAADLAYHQGWATSPQLGLVSVGTTGSVAISPGGPVDAGGASGTSAAIVTSDGSPVFLTANAAVNAYPASIFNASGFAGAPAAQDSTFLSGQLVGTSAASPSQVIALPVDWLAWQVVGGAEEGNFVFPYAASVERGVEVLDVTGTPPAAAALLPATRAPSLAARPGALPAASPEPGMGTAQPQFEVKVHGYTAAGQPLLATASPLPYQPAAIRAYLGLSGTGQGQTVAVVDAYIDPNIVADVNTFSSQFGLPLVCGTAGAGSGCFDFTTRVPQGNVPQNQGWALETSLDIEWIHAIAPNAAVRLIETPDSTFASLFAGVRAAAALHPDAISMSWGYGGGEFSQETYYDHFCALRRSVCVVASGDYGFPGSYPAYNPAAIAVGGTTLDLSAAGTVTSETTWAGSGGGRSYFEPKPAAQQSVVPGPRRGIPDVSFDANPSTGVAVYDSVPYLGQTGWFQVGGTSLGAPAWSAILASADQLRAAAGKPLLTGRGAARAIYAEESALGDITSGPPNGICPDICTAGPGYDFVTGLGSPRAGIDAALASAP